MLSTSAFRPSFLMKSLINFASLNFVSQLSITAIVFILFFDSPLNMDIVKVIAPITFTISTCISSAFGFTVTSALFPYGYILTKLRLAKILHLSSLCRFLSIFINNSRLIFIMYKIRTLLSNNRNLIFMGSFIFLYCRRQNHIM